MMKRVLSSGVFVKSAALAAILGSLAPELWREVAQRGLESLEGIGHGGVAETEAWILSQANGAAAAMMIAMTVVSSTDSRIASSRFDGVSFR